MILENGRVGCQIDKTANTMFCDVKVPENC